MLEPLAKIEARRLDSIRRQFHHPRVLSALNVEIDEESGTASVVWAERPGAPGNPTVAIVAFLIECARFDVALFARYQLDQERPS